jgi:hypothetical protein
MSSNTPVAKEGKTPSAAKARRKPPEDSFWKHYSPHHEFPLSLLSSAMLHAIGITFLLLVAFGIILAFRANNPVPFEAVRLADTGGGGGRKTGIEEGEGVGRAPEENVKPGEKTEKSSPGEEVKRPELTQAQINDLKIQFNDEAVRIIQSSKAAQAAMAHIDQEVLRKLHDGLSPALGEGGPGKGGGKDGGKDKGKGSGVGEGRASLSQREKRMFRWHLESRPRSGMDYLRQLHGLGAILAIPKPENPRDYYIVRDLLKRPTQLLNEDISKIQLIYWTPERPQLVHDVMQALDLQLRPSHFVAFFPVELEERLLKMELQYQGLKEDQITETWFEVVPESGGGYGVRVSNQTPRKR